ncbi:LytR C-terminal domain-containing protein [Kineococcus gypseus]|uniref:LytR C-terminal domain-containing protein n=1 Tax=Kineococcus gypseus TaxID=1637102 RepID=UPI003D7EB51D
MPEDRDDEVPYREREDRAPYGEGDEDELPEVSDDLDDASYERLQRRRLWRRRRQRAVFAVLVLLVLGVGGGAALLWTGRWQPGDEVPAVAGPSCAPAVEQPLLPPAEAPVEVLNGTDRSGLAAGVAEELRGRGFTVTRVGNAAVDAGPVTAVVRHPPDRLAQARTVAARVPEAQLVEDPAVAVVELVLGTAYQQLLAEDALAPPPPPPPGAPPAC